MNGKADQGDILEGFQPPGPGEKFQGAWPLRPGVGSAGGNFHSGLPGPGWQSELDLMDSPWGKAESRLGPRAPKNILMLSSFSHRQISKGELACPFLKSTLVFQDLSMEFSSCGPDTELRCRCE